MSDFDLVLWGATGFTGRLVAEYLTAAAPAGLRWALGGRSRERLEDLRARLSCSADIVTADAQDPAAIESMVRRTRVVASTVGPYALYGTPLVDACALHGVDYCDLTAEVPWIRSNIERLHETAEKNGARIVHCCGFDSIPSDLGVLTLDDHMRSHHDQSLDRASLYVVAVRGGFSGGTLASLLNLLREASRDRSVRRLMADPYSLNPPDERDGPDGRDAANSRYDSTIAAWTAPFLMAPINTRVVRRTNALSGFRYGRCFRYGESVKTRSRLHAASMSGLLKAFMVAGSLGPTRALLGALLPKPGAGPSRKDREAGFFKIAIHGTGSGDPPVSARVTVRGGEDPGYAGTAKMLGESALCLACDPPTSGGGILTPATGMGLPLVERLNRAGITFEVESTTERRASRPAPRRSRP